MSSVHFYHLQYDVYQCLPDGMVDPVLLNLHAKCVETHVRVTGSMPYPEMRRLSSSIYTYSLRIQRGQLDMGVCHLCDCPIAQRLSATGKQLRKYFVKYSPRQTADQK